MSSIFLSYSWKDKDFVQQLAKIITSYGIRVWLDDAEFKIGDSLIQKIGNAIDETDFVGVILSSNSINSEWVQRELNLSINKEFSARKVVVLPILLEPVEIPPFLRDKLYADFTNPNELETTLLKLLKTLNVSPIVAKKKIKQQAKKLVPILASITKPNLKAVDNDTRSNESNNLPKYITGFISKLNARLSTELGHVVDFNIDQNEVLLRLENDRYCQVFRLAISEFQIKTIDEIIDYIISQFGE